MKLHCLYCKTELKPANIDEEQKHVKCPKCGSEFDISWEYNRASGYAIPTLETPEE